MGKIVPSFRQKKSRGAVEARGLVLHPVSSGFENPGDFILLALVPHIETCIHRDVHTTACRQSRAKCEPHIEVRVSPLNDSRLPSSGYHNSLCDSSCCD